MIKKLFGVAATVTLVGIGATPASAQETITDGILTISMLVATILAGTMTTKIKMMVESIIASTAAIATNTSIGIGGTVGMPGGINIGGIRTMAILNPNTDSAAARRGQPARSLAPFWAVCWAGKLVEAGRITRRVRLEQL